MAYPARPYKPAQSGPVHSHLSLLRPLHSRSYASPPRHSVEHISGNAGGHGGRRREVGGGAEADGGEGQVREELLRHRGRDGAHQRVRRAAQLKPDTAAALRAAIPALTEELVELMMQPPFRFYSPEMVHEPAIYRLNEAIMHFGESIKAIINEDFGDGIMSAIDFYCTVDKVKGADGKDRVVLTFDGKYLPHTEQKSANMMSKLACKAP